ncbi:MAG: hypothetical protein QOH13_2414 [Thermoleophilaceae bacterium]|jgi:hypothetical protein|nr:hypothetical protein [Thermoleophilaceae bacterium]
MRLVLRRISISVLAALFLAAPAGAGTIIVKLTFVPGKLAVKAQPTTVAGTEQVPVTIADGRGNGNGWTLKVNSASAVRVVGITARCAANSTCTLPTAVSTPSGNIVLRAARDSGMGVMNLVVTLAAQSGSTPVSFTVS